MAVVLAMPLALLPAACGSSTDAGKDAASIAGVKDSQLRGVKIMVGDFFGDCVDAIGKNTDLTKAVDECSTMRTLKQQVQRREQAWHHGHPGSAAEWKSYSDAVNASFAAKKPLDARTVQCDGQHIRRDDMCSGG